MIFFHKMATDKRNVPLFEDKIILSAAMAAKASESDSFEHHGVP
jgi:hypothetical protein